MPTRPSAHVVAQSSSSSQIQHPVRIHQLHPLFARLAFHILTAKIEDVGRVYQCIDELGGKNVSLDEARFVVTALQGKPRLLKALGRDVLSSKIVLSVNFVYDCFERCLEAANSFSDQPPHLPDRREYLVLGPILTPKRSVSSGGESDEDSRPAKRARVQLTGSEGYVRRIREDSVEGPRYEDDLPDMEPFPEDVRLQEIPKRCVERPSPLICINQDIINAIKPIYEDREFEELQQKNSNVLSYRRSMSILKSLPRRIKSGKEARKMTDVGERVAQRIDEYLETGRVAESEKIMRSSRHKALVDFASVYTIGHHIARDLYDRHHCRTLTDVRMHFQNIAEESEEIRLKEKLRRRKQGGMTHVDIIEEWMTVKADLDCKIPREEVQEIADCVMEHLGAFIPGCRYTLTGGFRRGKPGSNDVDIVFCPPEEEQDIGLLQDLYLRLSALGIITHVLYVSHRQASTPIKAAANNFDNLDKAFVIFRLPGKGHMHRRVDLISAPKERYAAAVLSWSGSMMFERDLRRHAEERGLKFRAGLVEVNTGREINLETERDIFRYLGLGFVPPELRNADG